MFNNLYTKIIVYLGAAYAGFIGVLDLINSSISSVGGIPTWESGMSKRSEGKRWIRESTPNYAKGRRSNGEFKRFATIVGWIINNKGLVPHFIEFFRRIEVLIIRSSSTTAFAYLKETLRLIVRALAGSPELTHHIDGSIRVRRDHLGIPTILPYDLRKVLHAYILSYDAPKRESELEVDTASTSYWHAYHGTPAPQEKPDFNQRDIVGVLTCVSVFRTFATKVRASVKTIVNPFTGFVRTIPTMMVREALVRLNTKVTVKTNFALNPDTGNFEMVTIRQTDGNTRPPLVTIGKFIAHKSTKSGPNGSVTTWAAAIDALAFWHEWKSGVALIKWMWAQGAYLYLILFIFLNLTFGIIYISHYHLSTWIPYYSSRILPAKLQSKLVALFQFWRIAIGSFRGERDRLYCGKLSVVYDQAGKARVVASANWWIQSALKGLHNSIFATLRNMPQDGTFDQELAYERFISKVDRTVHMSGFDLSAATDRLPIELQVSILNTLGIDGFTWADMLNVTYSTPMENLENTRSVTYSVGQPMGAYSSWAMLALTHHVIVGCAAINAKCELDSVNYAVLGDDVVINNYEVAKGYVDIMSALGLEISMGKSVISTRFTEFAKKLRGPGVNFSPIGGGAVLAACRSGYMFPALLLACLGNIITSPNEILDLVKCVPSGLVSRRELGKYTSLVLWQLFGPSSPLAKYRVSFGRTMLDLLGDIPHITLSGHIYAHVTDSMTNLFTKRIRSQIKDAHRPMVHFLFGSFTIMVSGSPFMRVLETLMKPFNPGFWIFFSQAITLPIDLDKRWTETFASFPSEREEDALRCREIMAIMAKSSPELSVLTLDFTKSELKLRAKYQADLYKDMTKRQILSESYPLNTRWYELELGRSWDMLM
nr:MAG: putative RNA-dependent RNA polymerase [Mitoviridae sp.]